MKKLILGAAILLSSFAFKANAQLKVNFNLNIGSQPEWGPTGYDHVEYYYMPDIDAYYYVPGHQYVYLQNNAWARTTTLPSRYRNFDVYNSYKVVVNQPEPWRNQAAIRAKYARYKGKRGQTIIRDSRDNKYRNHWKGDNRGRNDNDHGKGNGRPNRGHGHN
jgi:hypothetical protein